MDIVDFGRKFESLAYLVSPKLQEALDKKFRAFNYKFDKNRYLDYHIGEKVGEDAELKTKTKTIKDFLNE